MKKWKIAVPAALAVLLALAVLRAGGRRGPVTVALNAEDAPVALAEDEHVWLTVDNAAATGATAVLHMEGIPRIGYGEPYYIARKEHDNSRKWTEVPWRGGEPSWWMLLHVLGSEPEGAPDLEHRESERTVDWTDIYGPLEPGEYLFVKEVLDPEDRASARYIGAAFTVE